MTDYRSSKTDPLSDVVALLKPQAVAWRVFEAHDEWSVRFPPTGLVVFGQMIEGGCEVERADGSTIDLQAGDFILMTSPAAWIARTAKGLAPVAFEALIDDPACLLSASVDPVVSRFMAGAFAFAVPNADLVAELFLPMIHIRAADIMAGGLSALLKLLGDEALASRPGRSLILDRLLDVILVETLRHRPAGYDTTGVGLLAGLADQQIGRALRLMHNDVQRPWTVSELARDVGMSRSSFAARFRQSTGASPIDYLSRWRINLAKAALKSARQPMSDIARLAGYQSVSAFSTAFSRATGSCPTDYIKSSM